jgi:hypothetical protein
MGFRRNLTSDEIFEQVVVFQRILSPDYRISNVVFMVTLLASNSLINHTLLFCRVWGSHLQTTSNYLKGHYIKVIELLQKCDEGLCENYQRP